MPSDDAEKAMSVSSTAETAGEPNDILVTGATGATGAIWRSNIPFGIEPPLHKRRDAARST